MEETNDDNTLQKLGKFVSESMDSFEEGLEKDAVLGDILIVCEFQRKNDNETTSTIIKSACSSDKAHIPIGLIRLVQLSLENMNHGE